MKTVLETARKQLETACFLALEMIDGRRRAEKQTAEDISGQSLSFWKQEDSIFAEVHGDDVSVWYFATLCQLLQTR